MQPDEFPLSLFYVSLQAKLADDGRARGRRGVSLIAVTGAGGALGQAVAARGRLEQRRTHGLGARSAEVDLLDAQATQAWADSLGEVDGLIHLVGGWKGGTDPESDRVAARPARGDRSRTPPAPSWSRSSAPAGAL